MKRLSPIEQHGGKLRRKLNTYAEALAQQKFELRFLLPLKCAGAIIGRKGDKIKTLRENFNATLQASNGSTPERVFTIVVDQEKLADCFKDVYKEMKNAKQEFEIRILIHESLAGAIIGHKGTKIEELRKQTHSKLKIFSVSAPESSPQERLPDIVKQTVDFIKEIPIKGNTVHYDPVKYNPHLVDDYGGYPSVDSAGDYLTYGSNSNSYNGSFDTYDSDGYAY